MSMFCWGSIFMSHHHRCSWYRVLGQARWKAAPPHHEDKLAWITVHVDSASQDETANDSYSTVLHNVSVAVVLLHPRLICLHRQICVDVALKFCVADAIRSFSSFASRILIVILCKCKKFQVRIIMCRTLLSAVTCPC
jgi:hypothetical protein